MKNKCEYYAIPKTAFKSAINLGVNNTKEGLKTAKSLEPMSYVLVRKIVDLNVNIVSYTKVQVEMSDEKDNS